jgi:ketosteroid isomerase-like protein
MSSNNRMHELQAFSKTHSSKEIYEEFYAEDVVVQENLQPPRVGRALSIERQKLMNANIKEVHNFKMGAILVDGDRSMFEMHLEATTQDGYRIHIEEVGLQTWKDGKIIHERYFYDPGSFEGKAKEYNQMH